MERSGNTYFVTVTLSDLRPIARRLIFLKQLELQEKMPDLSFDVFIDEPEA